MFNKRTLLMIGLVAAIAVSVAIVGIHPLKAQDSTNATVVTVIMREYSFQVDGQAMGVPLTLKTGTAYNLIIKNPGNMGHEIWFGRTLKKQDDRIDGYSTNLFTGVDMAVTVPTTNATTPLEVDTTAFYEVYLNPNEAVQLAFTLPASAVGSWELGCFQLLPTAKPAIGSDTSDNLAMTMLPGTPAATAVNATAIATANAAAPSPSHYDVGMKLPVVVQ